jgi:hypothetical protein
MNEYKLQYNIIDTECLSDYWSFQFRSSNMEKSKLIECTKDHDFYEFYKMLEKTKTSMYCYSINYDKIMLNSLCKFVENQVSNINWKMRRINDYLISGNLQYFRINREFWCDNFYKLVDKGYESQESFHMSIEKIKSKYNNDKFIIAFLDEFPYLLGKSKVFKNLNIIDIPKLMFYYSVRKDGIIRPTISLKNLQLFHEQTNIKFDFSYKSIEDIKKNDLYDTFKEYSLNDTDYLFRFFNENCLPILNTRLQACLVIKKFDNDFIFNDKMIHSESNTNLLVEAFKVPENQRNQQITMNYTDHIKETGYPVFDNIVKFSEKHKDKIKKDKTLKYMYCSEYNKQYIFDDSNIVEGNNIETKINSIDSFDLFGTNVTIGFGGIHGAIENYNQKNLWNIDYTSMYSSIILKFKKIYKNIINVDLYEALYNFKNKDVKKSIKELDDKLKLLNDNIKKSINDLVYISENESNIEKLEVEKEQLEKLKDGSKLLLNNLYGILNSEFNLPISNKTLGRFICLYGQYRAIELCKIINKELKESKLPNINTDGVFIENIEESIIDKIIEIDKDEYLNLEKTKIDQLIQYDVNNYIKIVDRKLKIKGNTFGTKIKQSFTRNEKLSCNMTNALKLIEGKDTDVKILPIYFHNTKVKSSVLLENEDSSMDKIYYLTSKDKGNFAIKNVVKPLILNLDGEIYYFTTNKKDADMKEYFKFARLTENKILDFTVNKVKNTMKYIKNPLNPDHEENIKSKKSIRLKINKILKPFNINCCIINNKLEILIDENNKVSENYSNYNLTDILKSKESEILGLKNIQDIVLVSTKDQNIIRSLDSFETFSIEHKITGFKCYVFSQEFFWTNVELGNIKTLNNDIIPIWNTNNNYICNINQIK